MQEFTWRSDVKTARISFWWLAPCKTNSYKTGLLNCSLILKIVDICTLLEGAITKWKF